MPAGVHVAQNAIGHTATRLPLLNTLESSAKQQRGQLSQGSIDACDSMPRSCQMQVHVGLSGPHWQQLTSQTRSCCTFEGQAAPTAAQQHAQHTEV